MTATCIPAHQFKNTTFPSYHITYEPITDRLTRVLNPSELKEYLILYEKAQSHPKQAQKEIEKWRLKYEHLPELYNLQSYVYVRQKKIRKAEKLIKQNYIHNPDNLFARINYADQCLRKGFFEKIPEIFGPVFDLNEMYPNRKTFHFSEVLGFTTLIGFYYLALQEKEIAQDYCTYAKLLDPEDTTLKHLIQKLSQKKFSSHFFNSVKKMSFWNKSS